MVLTFCSMLIHFASMPVPRALLGAGVALRALFVEPLSTQLAPKIIKTTYMFNFLLHVASFSFHACPKSYPLGCRCLLGSLFGTFLERWSFNSASIFWLRLL